MSSQSCPADENLLLYLNICGELFYIVVHRMECQGIETQLQVTVAHQLILGICSPEVVNDLAEGRLPISDQPFDVMRNMVKELVDSTIMKINDYSMEKLFEQTLIATKYQYTVCAHPKDLLLIALNHLDGMRSWTKEARGVSLTEGLHSLLVTSYGPRSTAQMESYRWAILHYVQDIKLKMTNLVNLGLQDENGDFIRQDSPVGPYRDRLNGEEEVTERILLCLELNGDRTVTLGRSIYDQKLTQGQTKGVKSEKKHLQESTKVMSDHARDGVKATQGLEFCSTLLGGGGGESSSNGIQSQKRQGWVSVGQEGEDAVEKLRRADSTQTIRIDARLDRSETKSILSDLVKEFDGSSGSRTPDAGATALLDHTMSPLQASTRNTLCKLMENMLIDEL